MNNNINENEDEKEKEVEVQNVNCFSIKTAKINYVLLRSTQMNITKIYR